MNPAVLIVCTGNICRSPMAQAVLMAGLAGAPGDSVQVSSAGTHALVGERMHVDAVQALEVWGIQVPEFTAAALTPAAVQQADLLLGATREHRAAIVRLAPARARDAYTLREFGRLAAAVDPAALPAGSRGRRLAALLTAVSALRGTLTLREPAEDDIPDPYGRGRPAFDLALSLIHHALRPAITQLGDPKLSI